LIKINMYVLTRKLSTKVFVHPYSSVFTNHICKYLCSPCTVNHWTCGHLTYIPPCCFNIDYKSICAPVKVHMYFCFENWGDLIVNGFDKGWFNNGMNQLKNLKKYWLKIYVFARVHPWKYTCTFWNKWGIW
jgi:hypothetical protein